MGDQIGHIPRTVAGKLAPYMVPRMIIRRDQAPSR